MTFWQCLVAVAALLLVDAEGAVRPPPWADPKTNPCATKPRGWQYIYWPADGQCYKIFQIGYPCPETMELVPAINTRRPRGIRAECRCPPASALHELDGRCYEIFKKGPCQKGQYYAPQKETLNEQESNKIRLGFCKNLDPCPDIDQIFWPADQKCYRRHSKGPCQKGQLLDINSDNLPACTCSNRNEMKRYYWEPQNACYEHFTKGPCQEKGHLFLPERICDCHSKLPHYHEESGHCFELESTGPCKQGHQFIIEENSNSTRATCKCKTDHIIWFDDGKCYRPYTQGPCPLAQILINSTSCIPIPCGKGSLYFPEQQTCYRIGSQGPCPAGQIVMFDFRSRPAIDGISYNGLCGCTGPLTENNRCMKEKRSTKTCDTGLVMYKNKCYKLYTQGPCTEGQWLIPNRQAKVQLWQDSVNKNSAKCDCKPGYTKTFSGDKNILRCLPPSVSLANYLNKYYTKDT